MGKIYLLNAPVVPIPENRKCVVVVTKYSDVDDVKRLIEMWTEGGMEMVSAIGHESTARLLSKMLGFEVKPQRISVTADGGDIIVAFTLGFRLPEGKLLSDAELEEIVASKQFSFTTIDILSCYDISEELSVTVLL
jgi:hypothetical protein